MKRSWNAARAALLLSTSVLLVTPGAMAAESGDDVLAEIIVTAQKVKETLAKAPVAISVLGADALDRQNITAADDLITTVPNLQFSQNGFAMRGIGSNNGFSGYSTVATQIDGIYAPFPTTLTLGMFDIAAIEVLRGPQGTVHGRNATAGVVNINTADPGRDMAVAGDVQYGTHQDLQVRLNADLPVNDDLAIRVSGFRRVNDGRYARLAAPERFDKTDQTALRLTSLWNLSDTVTWRLSLNYGEDEGTTPFLFLSSYNYYPNANLRTGSFGPVEIINTHEPNPGIWNVKENRKDIQDYAARTRLTWEMSDAVTATYIGGFSVLKNDGLEASTGVFSMEYLDLRQESSSHEIDINYESDKLSLVGGAYYYWDDKPSGQRLLHAGNTAPAPFGSVFNAFGPLFAGTGKQISTINAVDVVNTYSDWGSESTAIFAQGTLRLTDRFRLLAGIRSTWDTVHGGQEELVCFGGTVTRQNINNATCPAGGLGYSDDRNRASEKFSKISWKAGLDYDITEEVMGYATVSSGYRAGGLQASTNPAPYTGYKPETVTNYEAGLRGNLLDRKLFVSATLFNMDYKDLQVSSIIGTASGPTAVTTNAAKAKIKGVELETLFRPTRNDKLSAYVSFLDGKYTSFPNASDNMNSADVMYNIFAPILGYATIPSAVANFSGNRLANAPRWSARVGYEHIFDLAGGSTLTPAIDFYVQSRTYADSANYVQGISDGYTKTDVNLRWDSPDQRFYINAFVNNLEDERVANAVGVVWSSTTATYNPGRTMGVRVGASF